MLLDQNAYRALSGAISAPPEQSAVRSLTPLSSALGTYNAGQQAQSMRLGTAMMQGNEALAQAKRDMGLARRDSGLALGASVINTGLKGLGSYEMNQEAERQREREQDEIDFWKAMEEVILNSTDERVAKYKAMSQPAPKTTKQDWTMEGRGY